jgi:DNA mismatch repair protein MutS2
MLIDLVREPVKRKPKRAPKIRHEEEESTPERGLRVGDRVYVPSLNAEGEIAAMHAGHDVEVQVGALRVRADADTLELRKHKQEKQEEDTRYSGGVNTPSVDSPGLELHLRGHMVEDAIPAVDEYIDQAYMAGLPWVHIVHGRGTGALRKAIRDHLRGHPLVKEYGKAPENQGGDGVTVVKFAAR